jgi:hypothetical protein
MRIYGGLTIKFNFLFGMIVASVTPGREYSIFFYVTWLFSAQNATFSPAEVTSASDLSKTRQRTASAICGRRRELRVECTPATGVFNGKNGNRIVWSNGFTLISLEIKRFAESSISQVEQHGDRLHFGMKLALKELIE